MIKAALTILAVAGTGLFAQGGKPGDAVATVDGQIIEQQDFDHWMTIAARSSGSTAAPPDAANGYRRCIAAKRKAMPAPTKSRHKVTDAQLATQCKQDYAQLRDQVMQLLISFKWIRGRGRRPEHHRDRRRGRSGFPGSEAAELPQRRGLQEVRQAERPDAGGHTSAPQARSLVEQAPGQGHSGQGSDLRSGDRAVLRRPQIALRRTRETRPARRAHQAGGRRRAGPLGP